MRRVVITGIGAVTPVGLDAQTTWESAKAGKIGIGPLTHVNPEAYKVKLAAEIRDFDISPYVARKEARRMDMFTQFAMAAASMCMEDSGLDMEAIDAKRVDVKRFGVIIGSGIGGFLTIENEHNTLLEKGPGRVTPLFVPMIIGNMAAGQVALRFGLRGPCDDSVTACASGTTSIGNAFRLIKHGYADRMLAGGAEASITPMGLAGFQNITALSTSSDPARASIPFDKDRNGFVIGEGAGVVLLEEYEAAKARGARIYAEIRGYGLTCDAYHLTAPRPGGEGAGEAMRLALEEGGVSPDALDYINAHGTSTPPNDLVETQAIKYALGDHAYKIMVSSTKSIMGHMLGAAGAVEAIICALAIRDGFAPPTMGLKEPDPECDLDYLPGKGREGRIRHTLSNSLGFGGHNGTLLISALED